MPRIVPLRAPVRERSYRSLMSYLDTNLTDYIPIGSRC